MGTNYCILIFVFCMITYATTRNSDKAFVLASDFALVPDQGPYKPGSLDYLGVPYIHESVIHQRSDEIPSVLRGVSTIDWCDTDISVLYRSSWTPEVLSHVETDLVFIEATPTLRRRIQDKLFSPGKV